MTLYTTPFLVVNLGCEMIYVVEQRLKAQDIGPDKAERVLTDITSVLLNEKLLDELFTPQPVAAHGVVRQLLLDISSASIMRLDDYSAGKLWELATMIFKWQLAAGSAADHNIFDITKRHLRGVAAVVPQYFPQIVFDRARKRFDALSGILSAVDYESLNCTLLAWLSDYKTKISVLLRLGLQNKDGQFCAATRVNPKILKNLGENIYIYDTKKESVDEQSQISIDTSEISCLLSYISATSAADNSVIELKLPIEFGDGSHDTERKVLEIHRNTKFENICTSVQNPSDDLMFNPHLPKSTQEDLLAMLENESDI